VTITRQHKCQGQALTLTGALKRNGVTVVSVQNLCQETSKDNNNDDVDFCLVTLTMVNE